METQATFNERAKSLAYKIHKFDGAIYGDISDVSHELYKMRISIFIMACVDPSYRRSHYNAQYQQEESVQINASALLKKVRDSLCKDYCAFSFDRIEPEGKLTQHSTLRKNDVLPSLKEACEAFRINIGLGENGKFGTGQVGGAIYESFKNTHNRESYEKFKRIIERLEKDYLPLQTELEALREEYVKEHPQSEFPAAEFSGLMKTLVNENIQRRDALLKAYQQGKLTKSSEHSR